MNTTRSKNSERVPRARYLLSSLFVLMFFMTSSAWASLGLTFQGLVRTLNTGGNYTFNAPAGIAVDPAGNVYVVDTGNNRVVKISAQGTDSILSMGGLSPDLSSPTGITVDDSGNVYIADTGNDRIVKVDSTGTAAAVSTGSVPVHGPQGVALDSSGNLFIADTTNNRIVEVTSGGSAAALSIAVSMGASTLNHPSGLAVDTAGKLYIADSANNRVVTVASGSTTGSVLSITGGMTLSSPSSVAVDRIGNVYIADSSNNRIAEVATTGTGTVLFAYSETLVAPAGIAINAFGSIFVADSGHNRAVIVDSPINGNLTPSDLTYSLNKSSVGFGHIQLGSGSSNTLILPFTTGSTGLGGIKVLTSGTENLDFTAGADTTCTSASGPSSLCTVEVKFLPSAAGLRFGAVVLLDPSLSPLLTVPLYGFSDAPLAALSPNTGSVINTGGLATLNPYQTTLDGLGNMYVGDYSGKNVTKISAGGGSAAVVPLGSPGSISVQNVTGIALDGAGNLFIGDHQNSRILVATPGGVVSVLSISGLSPALGFPTALAFDASGNLYIADFTNGRIVEITSLVVAGSTASGKATVVRTGSYSFTGSTLTGMTVDPQGTIYAAARTQNNSNIIKVSPLGVASLLAIPSNITPALSNPQGVASDSMGNVYVVDTAHNRIVKITSAGVGSVLSISGLSSPSTLGNLLFGTTADASGNLYISDWSNNRIVYVNVSGGALSFASTKQGLTSTDSPQSAVVTNLGNQPLAFSADPGFTADFSNGSGGSKPCTQSTTLAAGTACSVMIQFTPQSVGSLSAGIIVTDNSLNVSESTQQFAVSGVGTNPGDTTSTTITATPSSLTNGQPVALTATVSDTTSGHTATIPTGSVTFSDTLGSTVVSLNGGAAVSLVSGTASLPSVVLSGVGTHTITANYAGASGTYMTSSTSTTVTVAKAGATVTGPTTTPVGITVGQSGSVDFTLTGAYSSLAPPSGTLSYVILNASSSSVASGTVTLTTGSSSSTASIPVPNTLAPGSYTASITYSGDSNYLASATATTVALQVSQLTVTVSWAQPSPIVYGTNLAAVLNATALHNTTAIPGTFAYTATPAGGTASAVTSATVLPAGSYTLSASFTPSDSATYTTASGSISLTVGKATPSITLVSSKNPVLRSAQVTFTAAVPSAATGTISFYDGTTLLGSTAISQGNAAFSTTNLATGTHSITAVYSGDGMYLTVTSSALSQVVEDFTVTLPTSGSGSGGTASAVPGGTAAYGLLMTPTSGSTFPAAVTFSVTGLPAGATATFTPATLPAGSSATNVTLSIQLPAHLTAMNKKAPFSRGVPLLAGLLVLPFGEALRRFGKKKVAAFGLLMLLTLLLMMGLAGCGGSASGYSSQQTYTLTVTATSGTVSHSTTLNLVVN